MNVAQLMEELSELPADAQIFIETETHPVGMELMTIDQITDAEEAEYYEIPLNAILLSWG